MTMDKNLIMKELQKPFKEEEIEWRVGATNKDKSMGLALPYVTNKAIQNRLDEVFGVFGWKNEYKEWKSNSQLCGISIWDEDKGEWLTKWDGADDTNMESTKGGLSDSMKRAAVQLGIGRYLYKLEAMWVPLKDGKYLSMNPSLPMWALPKEEQEERREALGIDEYGNTVSKGKNQSKPAMVREAPVQSEREINQLNKPSDYKVTGDMIKASEQFVEQGKQQMVQRMENQFVQQIPKQTEKQIVKQVEEQVTKQVVNQVEEQFVSPSAKERPAHLISEKQMNLFHIKAKGKSKMKVYDILGKFGYGRIDMIEKKNFNTILYYIDQLELVG